MPARSLALAFALAVAATPAPAAELKHLHVLLVIDTTDKSLKESVERDQRRMTELFKENVPAERYTLTPLAGSLTKDKVLAAVKALKPGPDDGVVFYYAGHGGQDTRTKRLFFATGWTPDNGRLDPLFRDDVRKALTATNPGLAVLLTDCCSNPIDLKKTTSRGVGEDGRYAEPPAARGLAGDNLRRLFFDARGVVDVTASTDDLSWGTPIRGGFFTSSFAKVVTGTIEPGAPAQPPVASWEDLVNRVAKETPSLHEQQVKRGLVPPLPGRVARFQTPKAYSFGRMAAAGGVAVGGVPAGKVFAVIALRTPEAAGMTFNYRWTEGRSGWVPVALKTDVPEVVFVEVPPGQPFPSLEVDLADSLGQKFKAKRYEGAGPPKLEHAERYKVTPPK